MLELACGTGRLTRALAAAGITIVGLDSDLEMLSRAQAHARTAAAAAAPRPEPAPGVGHGPPAPAPAEPRLLAADMRNFALAARFAVVFVGYNSLQLLTDPADMVACLQRAREHLTPGGVVGVEITDFQVGGADGPAGEGVVALGGGDGVRLSGQLVHDLGRRVSRYTRHFEGAGWRVDNDVVVRSLNRPELEAVLAEAGLRGWRWSQSGPTVRALATPT